MKKMEVYCFIIFILTIDIILYSKFIIILLYMYAYTRDKFMINKCSESSIFFKKKYVVKYLNIFKSKECDTRLKTKKRLIGLLDGKFTFGQKSCTSKICKRVECIFQILIGGSYILKNLEGREV